MSTPDPITQELNDFVEKTIARWNLPWYLKGIASALIKGMIPALVAELEAIIAKHMPPPSP